MDRTALAESTVLRQRVSTCSSLARHQIPSRTGRTHRKSMTPIGRRRFLGALVTTGAVPMLGAHASEARCFVGCRVDREGRFLASGFDESGRIHFDVRLPGRGHGFAVQPWTGHVVVFARCPGSWALILDRETGAVLGRLAATEGRHFYGHGVFSPDGAFLYTSENRFEDGNGLIGVWDTVRNWRRVHEWSSHGVGPHEIRVDRKSVV